MKVKIVKPEAVIFEGEASKVTLPSESGEMTILPHHISIVTALKQGRLIVYSDNVELLRTEIFSGFCSFSNDYLSVIVDK